LEKSETEEVKRIKREFYGVVAQLPPHRSGALAQCGFCEWCRFFPDRKRLRYSAVARASASLHLHAKKVHADKFPSIATQIRGERVRLGIRRAEMRGVKIGRPRLMIDLGKLNKLAARMSLREIAGTLGCSKTYVGKKLRMAGLSTFTQNNLRAFHNTGNLGRGETKMILWRRHKTSCAAAAECRCRKEQKRECHCCRCPIWADGYFGASRIRKSLDTGDWSKAQRSAEDIQASWEKSGSPAFSKREPVLIETACEDFLANARARGLREDSTVYKYRLLFAQLKAFARDKGLRFLTELDLPGLRKFRACWTNENFSAQKKLESLRTFFRFAQSNGWIAENAAVKLESPKTRRPQVLPFTREEMVRIFSACDAYGDNYGKTGQENSRRLRALVLLLRYSGLRIGDVVSLPRERIAHGKLFLYTAKTGTPVQCPLPDAVIQSLDAVRGTSENYFFWTGGSKLKSAVGDWQRSLKKLFVLAGVSGGHPHRFRHTFAVELLLAGVPIERVSVLLGHSSTRITEKHYSAWVRARQEQLEADVRQSWALESGLLSLQPGTQRARGKTELVN
jgi:integrase/recombinase XerD